MPFDFREWVPPYQTYGSHQMRWELDTSDDMYRWSWGCAECDSWEKHWVQSRGLGKLIINREDFDQKESYDIYMKFSNQFSADCNTEKMRSVVEVHES